MTNIDSAKQILTEIRRAGVRTIAVAAGARNGPLLELLFRSDGFEVIGFFDERSAGFFSLGRAKQTARPTAVITTSGTAAAELLPAVIEAHYSGIPLIVITADRPGTFRGSGAPQTIEQVGLYGDYVEQCLDIENSNFTLSGWSRRQPIHLNPCFAEPLIDQPVEALDLRSVLCDAATPSNARQVNTQSRSAGVAQQLNAFAQKALSPLVIVGELPPEDTEAAIAFLAQLNHPLYLEAHSQLRECSELQKARLLSGERLLSSAFDKHWFDSVIRLGGIPTVRCWRDLNEAFRQVPVLSISRRPFSGLDSSRGDQFLAPFSALLEIQNLLVPRISIEGEWRDVDRRIFSRLEELFGRFPGSEPALVHYLSRVIPPSTFVYLGNSMPIRHWDFAAEPRGRMALISGNRGANGIDGQVSTFLGMCAENRPNVALIGDLTALYDATGLWAVRHLSEQTGFTVVVLNNGGGKIFEQMFRDERFQMKHDLSFASWAEQWGLNYEMWREIPEKCDFSGRKIIELRPNLQQTHAFRSAYEELWTII